MPYSFSQLNTYQTCPRQYEFANVKKISRSISAGESFGSSVHNTLSKWGKMEMESAKPNNPDGQLKLFTEDVPVVVHSFTEEKLVELWHQSFIYQGYDSKVDGDKARAKGEVLMKHFFQWWSTKKREVLTVETGFVIEDANARGRFDRVEKEGDGSHVIDFKTGGMRTQQEVDEDLQLSVYTLAAEQEFAMPCSKLTLLFLHEDGITEVSTTRSSMQLHKAKELISTLGDRIEDMLYDPTPSEDACRRCPYQGICDAAIKS